MLQLKLREDPQQEALILLYVMQIYLLLHLRIDVIVLWAHAPHLHVLPLTVEPHHQIPLGEVMVALHLARGVKLCLGRHVIAEDVSAQLLGHDVALVLLDVHDGAALLLAEEVLVDLVVDLVLLVVDACGRGAAEVQQ